MAPATSPQRAALALALMLCASGLAIAAQSATRKGSRYMLGTSNNQAEDPMAEMTDEEMFNYMFDEQWPPLPPSPPPDAPHAYLSVPPPPEMPGGDDPEVVGDFSLVGIGNIVAVHMVHIPGTNRYFFMERPSGKHPDKSAVIAGFWDLDTLKFVNIPATDSLFCAGHTVTADGDILVVGGHIAKSGYGDGLKGIRIFNRTNNYFSRVGNLMAARWYPSATLLPDGQVFVVGGTVKPGSGTGSTPYYELWNPANPAVTTKQMLSTEFYRRSRDIYYPNNYVIKNGLLFMFCDTYGEIINPYTGTTITPIPQLGGGMRVLTQYPYTGTSVQLPLSSKNNYNPEVVYFGGQYSYGWINTTASNMAWRLKVTINGTGTKSTDYDWNGGWQKENMLQPRVMPDATLLPNGHVLIVNGARRGVAGDSAGAGKARSNDPNMWPEIYNPDEKVGRRFTAIMRTTIPRLYHSVAALTPDGTVIVTGCDRCDARQFWTTDTLMKPSPWGLPEYRIEVVRPPVWFRFTEKPEILGVSTDVLAYGAVFTLNYKMFDATLNANGAILMAPSATTHSTNMNQRGVILDVVDAPETADNPKVMVLRAPPDVNVAPPGWYMLFLLNNDVYSKAIWMRLPIPGSPDPGPIVNPGLYAGGPAPSPPPSRPPPKTTNNNKKKPPPPNKAANARKKPPPIKKTAAAKKPPPSKAALQG